MNVKLLNHNYASNEFEARLADIIRVSYGKTPSLTADCERDATKDRATIRNCFNAGHMSVFEFVDATVFIECPIYVARQIMRYRCASYLERSLRRCEPLEANIEYQDLIARGVSKENARAVLPLSTQTQFYMKANLREWFHIFDERINTAAQAETNYLVQRIKEALKDAYPLLIELWEDKRKTKTSAENLNV